MALSSTRPVTLSVRTGARKPGYKCRKHHAGGVCDGPVSSIAGTIDEYVECVFLEHIANQIRAPGAVLADATLAAAEQAARQAEADLVTYRDDPAILAAIGGKTYADGLVVRAERVEEALAILHRARDSASASSASPPAEMIDAWPSLGVNDKRLIVGAAIDTVVLRRAATRGRHGPISERVEILWRGEAPELSVRHRGRVPFGSILPGH